MYGKAAGVVLGLVCGAWVAHRCTKRARGGRRLKLLIHGVQKRQNIGSLLRVAVAMGVEEVLLVGKNERKDFGTFGAHGTQKHAKFAHHATLTAVKKHLQETGFDLVGVEIMSDARAVSQYWGLPFNFGLTYHPWGSNDICIVMGNEGWGLHESVKAICDWYVYIPQYSQGTASLNVTSAAAVILSHFAAWRGHGEAVREGEKFVVDKPLSEKERYEASNETSEFDEIRRARAAAKVEVPDEDDEACEEDIFDDE